MSEALQFMSDNDLFSLIAKLDQECNVRVKTPCGISDRFTLNEIVMQGSVWGPLLCTTTMDKIGQKAYKTGHPLYKGH